MARHIAFANELTISTIGDMANSMLHALQGGQEVTVSLTEVERIDCAALQVLVAAMKEAGKNGVTMTCSIPAFIKTYAASVGVAL
ncbi:lipid asymmetry maintenance protein MlaB [Geobacter sp. SVR]|uniref:STAS domain-containing protein n=1 Tax=Geobacter sp. SVR TaxID=2495594 RepID=UPI001566437C|nr:STAS domain-containing protein [Geobacter sp. SVR]